MDETFEILKEKKIGLIRADSGFYAHDFLNYLETEKQINYIIAVKMYPNIKKEIQLHKTWWSLKDGVEICEFDYQSPDWKKPRRMVVVRKKIEILTKATGKLLLFPVFRIEPPKLC